MECGHLSGLLSPNGHHKTLDPDQTLETLSQRWFEPLCTLTAENLSAILITESMRTILILIQLKAAKGELVPGYRGIRIRLYWITKHQGAAAVAPVGLYLRLTGL